MYLSVVAAVVVPGNMVQVVVLVVIELDLWRFLQAVLIQSPLELVALGDLVLLVLIHMAETVVSLGLVQYMLDLVAEEHHINKMVK
jgi:hypothetical protein